MFHDRLKRPNILVKIPATEEGIPAIEEAIYAGISVNVTLIFSLDRYRQVIEAYLKGIERREAEGLPVNEIFSVASFFVSRFDTKVDKMLDGLIDKATNPADKEKMRSLKGKGAIANAKIAYQLFQQEFSSDRWKRLAAKGANVQRPLWASTSTKNPDYPDTLYADALIGPDTVDTMPNPTIEAFLDHGTVKRTVDQDVDQAHQVIDDLVSCGISMEQVMQELEDEGVASFAKSYETLGQALTEKCAALHQGQEQNAETELGPFQGAVHETLARLEDAGQRIWNKDGSWWSSDREVQEKIVDRLGWLNVVKQMINEADNLRDFANEACKAGFERVLVMGMGGSSLAPDLFSVEFETADGFPELYVLDSTDPAVVALCRDGLPSKDTLYVVSSKSGTTTEPNAFFAYFWEQVKKVKGDRAGEHFIAITDPGTPLVDLARHYGFRRIFENPPDIGGRYSALSYFGLVPAALMGIDVRKLLDRAYNMIVRCGPGVPAAENPGIWLGAALGTFATQGRDKVTFVTTPGVDGFGDWAEQLLAESTGKEGKGLVPVAREEVGPPEVYGDDRVFVYLRLATDETDEFDEAVDALIDAGQPVITLPLDDEYDLGAEFFRWEMAVAVAGKVLGINPFDEPNVTESKNNTKRLLDQYVQKGRLPEEEPAADEGEIEMFVYPPAGAVSNGSTRQHRRPAGSANRNGASDESGPLVDHLQALFDTVQPHDYVAILAYLEPSEEDIEQLEAMRIMIRDVLKVATTIGFGPRFLHSTGQLHKGGPNTGVFLILTSDEAADIKIPGQRYSFGTLIRAQALGDIEALVAKGRRVIRLHLMNVEEGLEQVADLVDAALPAEATVE